MAMDPKKLEEIAKNVKKRAKRYRFLFFVGGIFWFAETMYFMATHGFHWKAINEVEEACDGVVSGIFMLGIILFFSAVDDVITILTSDIE